jgi:hypothetical protein
MVLTFEQLFHGGADAFVESSGVRSSLEGQAKF